MRVTAEEKAKIKDRILRETMPFLKKSGLSGAPVDQIMSQVGLTSGALYSHFESKEDLFAQALLRELDHITGAHEGRVKSQGPNALAAFIELYLSKRHLNEVAKGCVFVALGADIHRQKPKIRALYQDKIQNLFRVLARSLPGEADRTGFVSFVFSSLVGALILARSMNDEVRSEEILTSTKHYLISMVEQTFKPTEAIKP